MNLKRDVLPITYLKNHTAELVGQVAEEGGTVMITQNGRARVVVMDVETYDRWQASLAMLKILAHAEADVATGRTLPLDQAFARAEANVRQVESGD